jgi:hypothetical protein
MMETGSFLIFVPWIAKVFPKWSGYTKIRANIDEFSEYFRKPIKEHMSTYKEDYQRFYAFYVN